MDYENELAPYDRWRKKILGGLYATEGQITSMRLHMKNIHGLKHFSFGTWSSRQHVIVGISAGGRTGFGECIMSVNQPDSTLEPWKNLLEGLPGLETGRALREVRSRQGIWPEQLVEMMEIALVDLCGKLTGRSANSLLGLAGEQPVWGVHVILSDDLAEVEESTCWAKKHGKNRFIKVKLFGRTELDCGVVRTVRKICPREETFLIGDVNCGYRMEGEETSLEQIGESMGQLEKAGLDACEDPAFLTREEWVELQSRVSPLQLIPDYPMRSSRRSIKEICRGMGGIYNIHPDSAGSIVDAVVLARRIKELGAGLMVGDDSLVGPSASVWQQLACGLEARWVEATEKREESDFFYRCVRSLATDSRKNPILITLQDGFGIDIDQEKLEDEADLTVEILAAESRER